MQSCSDAIARLCDPTSEVSAHYIIDRSGAVTQMVAETMRAWHAGQGEWRGMDDINSRSIGIELDNAGTHPFSNLQMNALEALLADIKCRWNILPENIIGHSDMAPGRKHDPGAKFDWARLARQGLAGPVQPCHSTDDFRQVARAAGFTAPVEMDTLLCATRLRFAPWRSGPFCKDDLGLFHQI